MIGRGSREDIDGYGVWPWIGSVIFAGILIWIMFAYANPIS
ncbi:hypothetical protein [Notoacmeibacter sp. MSK16QG-6]|nr:hypothetical protein [Notoacmeibacter sp. MSK16QG-6]